MTTQNWEITQRVYDNKWVRWELIDSRKIGETTTWSRFKWVITDVWDKLPVKLINKYNPHLKEIQEKVDGRKLYIFQK